MSLLRVELAVDEDDAVADDLPIVAHFSLPLIQRVPDLVVETGDDPILRTAMLTSSWNVRVGKPRRRLFERLLRYLVSDSDPSPTSVAPTGLLRRASRTVMADLFQRVGLAVRRIELERPQVLPRRPL